MRTDHLGNRNGVAIVLVVGMLAVLMLMAVAFSISMRIERRGAGMRRFNVQAEHMTRAALSEAMYAIDQALDPGPSGEFKIYPDWGVLASHAGDANLLPAQVLTGPAMGYVPMSLDAEAQAAQPRWGEFRVASDGENVLRGRYAFVAINSAGLLDANVVGGSNRVFGLSPAEIPLAGLRDFANPGDPAKFLSDRKKHMRYETLPELCAINGSVAARCPAGWTPYDLAVYSRAVEGKYLNAWTGCTQVAIGGDVADLEARRAEIAGALQASRVANGNVVFDMLLDYLDTDNLPYARAGGTPVLNKPCAEAVPMINEVAITDGTVEPAEGFFIVNVEWVYPFVNPTTRDYRLSTVASGEWKNVTQNLSEPFSVSNEVNICGAGISMVGAGAITPRVAQTEVYKNFGNAWNTGDVVRLSLGLQLRVTEAGTAVDSVPGDSAAEQLVLTKQVVLPASGPVALGHMGMECVDPRFNWSAAAAQGMWYDTAEDGNSLWKTNFYTAAYLGYRKGDPYIPSIDEGMLMYVSNRGHLESVGELGYVLRGNNTGNMDTGSPDYFKTIGLYDRTERGKKADRDLVLKYFTLAGGTFRGRINVNTTNAAVLAAAFVGAPVVTTNMQITVGAAAAQDIAGRIVSGGPYYDISDLGTNNWSGMFPGWSDLERESLLVNALGLLTVRQNLFTIVLAANSYSMQVGGDRAVGGAVLASTYAVAEVWRDPFRSLSGKHDWNVRYFRIVEH